jgi:N-acetylglucosamine kinase-like BadF-type ATPase
VSDYVIAVDGGNVKTDLALVAVDGSLVGLVRGGRSSPHYEGVEGCVELIGGLVARAAGGALPEVAANAQVMMAGVDLPEELESLQRAIAARGWARSLTVDNDTFALLRSGTDRGWGVAVVCGGGINCVGRSPDGREARFPALGAITGDWGGGYDIGVAALSAAARSADGRGPKTALEGSVPSFFGLEHPFDVARAVHLRELPHERLAELTRVVFPAAAGPDADPVAAEILARQAGEVVAMATVALTRLGLEALDVDVVLGGGVLRAAGAELVTAVAAGVRALAPAANVVLAPSAPIVGAALLALDALGRPASVTARARAELDRSFGDLEGDGARVSQSQTISAGASAQALLRGAHG